MRDQWPRLLSTFFAISTAGIALGSEDAPQGAAAPSVEEKDVRADDAGIFSGVTWQHSSNLSLTATEGVDPDRVSFLPTRELRLTDKAKVILNSTSLIWNVRVQINRNVMTKSGFIDDPYAVKPTTLPNGSVIGKGYQLIVQEAYVQESHEKWLLQVGSQLFGWGSADSINPMAVFNPPDLRLGFIGEKETKVAPIPAAKFALIADGSTLNFVYAPWRRAPLTPSYGQNWYVTADNFAFNSNLQPTDRVDSKGSLAIKYDRTIPDGDISLLYYKGADYDVTGIINGLIVENNQPLVLDVNQVVPEKTSLGASYTQTFGKWVMKAESLYTLNKQVLPSIDANKIQDQSFPIGLRSTPAYQITAGFNYFSAIKDFFGIPLGDTVFTAEYYRSRLLAKETTQPFISDLILTNIRTSFLDDRLETLLSYVVDFGANGSSFIGKLTFAGESLRHGLTYSSFDGHKPSSNQIGSLFYYWRANDHISYEISYPL